ncbi:DgyrCDS9289 [Dimorphilus gyrociliatus]|uniref:DgyrCDS9289 n=1 Tax=Dimorphilus gyrociliatus TaxID=2664684 RepID=A0A7I8VWJ7_9ANNE|nr:DgyrCDS9289 [Dimorphilus gyrociliatus]
MQRPGYYNGDVDVKCLTKRFESGVNLQARKKSDPMDLNRMPSLKVAKKICLSERRKIFENSDENSDYKIKFTREVRDGNILFSRKSPVFRRRSVNVKETIKSYEFDKSTDEERVPRRHSELPPFAEELTMEDNPLYDQTFDDDHLKEDGAEEVNCPVIEQVDNAYANVNIIKPIYDKNKNLKSSTGGIFEKKSGKKKEKAKVNSCELPSTSEEDDSEDEEPSAYHKRCKAKLQRTKSIKQDPNVIKNEGVYEFVKLKSTRISELCVILTVDEINNEPVVNLEFCCPEKSDITALKILALPDLEKLEKDSFGYVQILTSAEGAYTYLYCRRIYFKNENKMEIYAILTNFQCDKIYDKLLLFVETLRTANKIDDIRSLLRKCTREKIPEENETTKLSENNSYALNLTYVDCRKEVDYAFLLERTDVEGLTKIFSAALLESKLIFVSENLHVLTKFSTTFMELLYPFKWPHFILPATPSSMKITMEKPGPAINGFLLYFYEKIESVYGPPDDVMIVNLDSGSIEENDTVLLPKKLKKPLVASLSNISCHKREQASDLIRESFQRLLATLFQDYSDYLYKSDMYYDFKRDEFIESLRPKSVQSFTNNLVRTAHFDLFVQWYDPMKPPYS